MPMDLFRPSHSQLDLLQRLQSKYAALAPVSVDATLAIADLREHLQVGLGASESEQVMGPREPGAQRLLNHTASSRVRSRVEAPLPSDCQARGMTLRCYVPYWLQGC